MGEARNRKIMGFPPRAPRPGEPIKVQINLKDSQPRECACGCKYFLPVVMVHIVSPLMSPTGQELVAQLPAFVCLECHAPFVQTEGQDKKEGILP